MQGDGVLGDGVEPEEGLGAVEDVELEHRRRAVHADLGVGGFDKAEVGQLGDGLGDCLDMTAGYLPGPLPERGLVGKVADPARD